MRNLFIGKLADFRKAQFEEVEEIEHPIIPGVDR